LAEARTAVAADYDVADIKLAAQGDQRVAWAARDMPVLAQIRDRFQSQQPFRGLQVGG